MFPEQLFQSPPNWGEETLCDEDGMDTTISNLKELGEDWEGISISDCNEWNLVELVGAKAIYQYGLYDEFCVIRKDTIREFVIEREGFQSLEWAKDWATE